MTHLIIDGADMDNWQRHHAGGLLIPTGKRPTVLQADRDRAEFRLQGLHGFSFRL